MTLEFVSHGVLTLGIEIEVQLVDWKTKDLCPAAPRLLGALGGTSERIKPEIFQSMLEMCTGVCRTVDEANQQLRESQSRLLAVCEQYGVEVVGAGAHPFARYDARVLYPSDRYRKLIDRNQWIARRLAIFGLHVHIGMPDGDRAMQVQSGLLPYLANLLALSASSPFLQGQDTGLASARTTVFESQPSAGTPPTFASWDDYVQFVEVARRGRAVESLKDFWWDLRPNPGFGTLEVRICDGGARMSDSLAIVALVQCLCADLLTRLSTGESLAPASQWRLRENKWRAARLGLDADLLIDEQGEIRPARELVAQLCERLVKHSKRLGCEPWLQHLLTRLDKKASYERQRSVYTHSQSLMAVVDALAREWRDDSDVLDG